MQNTLDKILWLSLLLFLLFCCAALYAFVQIASVCEELGLTSEKFRNSSWQSRTAHIGVVVLVTALQLFELIA